MNKPTIAELEAILEEKGVEIDIRPSGEVYVKSELQDAIHRAEQAEARAEAAERDYKALRARYDSSKHVEKWKMWKPIESAPKDGTAILLLTKPYEEAIFDETLNHPAKVAIGHWWAEGSSWVPEGPHKEDEVYTLQETGVWSSGGGWFQPDEVTHWMLLPAATADWKVSRKFRARWRVDKIHRQAKQIIDLVAKVEAADRDIKVLQELIATKDEIAYQSYLKAEARAEQLKTALTKVEAYMASEEGPIFRLWENCDIGDYDDYQTDWEQTLFDVRDWKNGCVPTASLGGGTEWPEVLLYREILAALSPAEKAAPTDEVWGFCEQCGASIPVALMHGMLCPACVAESPAEQADDEKAPTFDLVRHLHRQRAFSLATFGPGERTAGVLDHIRKELKEIEENPKDKKEWADLALLTFDGAWRHGVEPEDFARAIEEKQTINEGRNWPDWRTCNPDRAIEHVRNEPTAA